MNTNSVYPTSSNTQTVDTPENASPCGFPSNRVVCRQDCVKVFQGYPINSRNKDSSGANDSAIARTQRRRDTPAFTTLTGAARRLPQFLRQRVLHRVRRDISNLLTGLLHQRMADGVCRVHAGQKAALE